MKTLKTVSLALLLSHTAVFAHGENRPGPHGGEIRMPGAFHTEVVKVSPVKFKVYLLDINFKGPTTSSSLVTAQFRGKQKHEATCAKERDYFVCSFDTEVLNTKGELELSSSRENSKGRMVKYNTPL